MIRFPTTEKQSRWRRHTCKQTRWGSCRVADGTAGLFSLFISLQTDKLTFLSACQTVCRCLALPVILYAASPFINQNIQTNGGSL
ncbi:MAG: hypothetical protein HF973_07300 [Chloroflexi bacterium]|nr:hypothetical protein [Chloroflexota bacterium]